MSIIEIAILINSLVIIGLIIAVMILRSNFKRLDEKSFELWRQDTTPTFTDFKEPDPLEDHKLLARMLTAKKAYCMDYNKENGLYCQRAKSHKSWGFYSGRSIKHKTHRNGQFEWAMVKKVKV